LNSDTNYCFLLGTKFVSLNPLPLKDNITTTHENEADVKALSLKFFRLEEVTNILHFPL